MARFASIKQHRPGVGCDIKKTIGLGDRFRQGNMPGFEGELPLSPGCAEGKEGLRLVINVDDVVRAHEDIVGRVGYNRTKWNKRPPFVALEYDPGFVARKAYAAGTGHRVKQTFAAGESRISTGRSHVTEHRK